MCHPPPSKASSPDPTSTIDLSTTYTSVFENNWAPMNPVEAFYTDFEGQTAPMLTIIDLPPEVHLMIYKELHNISDIATLRKTCRYFNAVLSVHEVLISKFMSQCPSLFVPASQNPDIGRSIASIYTAEAYTDNRPSYAWISLLQSRSESVRSVVSFNSYMPSQPFPVTLLYGDWNHESAHVFWHWCELPVGAAFAFLDALDPGVRSGVCDFYNAAVFAVITLAFETPRPTGPTPGTIGHSAMRAAAQDNRLWAQVMSRLWDEDTRIWDLMFMDERWTRHLAAEQVLVPRYTMYQVGVFIISAWAAKDGFLGGARGEPAHWPSSDVALGWLNTGFRDWIELYSGFCDRATQLVLFSGIREDQGREYIKSCEEELRDLREAMAEPRLPRVVRDEILSPP